MDLFVWSLIIGLAFVVGAWIRLAPSADERRLAALRDAAARRGLKLRWISGAERERLGIPPGLTWYGLQGPDTASGNGAASVAVLRGGVWQWVEGVGPEVVLQDVPTGISALQIGGGVLQAAWDERDGALLDPLALWLERRLAGLGSANAPHPH